MKMKVKLKLMAVITVFLNSCATKSTLISELPLGTKRRDVIQKLGDPYNKYRSKGKEHLVYQTYKKPKDGSKGYLTYSHILIFEEGALMKKTFERDFSDKEIQEFNKD